MSIVNFNSSLRVASFDWKRYTQDVINRSIFGMQAMNGGYPLWKVALTFDKFQEAEAGPYQSLMMQLDGSRNQLALWNVGRPVPRGTMRGAPTLVTGLSAGSTQMTVYAAGQAGTTLKAGDYLGIGVGYARQVVMVLTDATLDGSGQVIVNFLPAVRQTCLAGSSVTWNQPTALFRAQTTELGWGYSGVTVDGMALDLLEDWRQ